MAGESATESSLIPLKGWRQIFIYTSFHLFLHYLVSGQQYEPRPHGNGHNSESSGKDQESSFHPRPLVPPWHLGGGQAFHSAQLLLDICHASKV